MRLRGYCNFYKNLYLASSVKNPVAVKWKLRHGVLQPMIYIVTGAHNESDQLEIMHSAFLTQRFYRKHPVRVYGIAGSYQEALDIVIRISDEAHSFGMDGDLIGFLSMIQGE